MFFLRLIGWLLIAAALALLAREAYLWLATDRWNILSAYQLWFNLHQNSLHGFQAAIERNLSIGFWNGTRTVLDLPAWVVLGIPGLLLALLRRRRRHADSKRRYFKSR
ncbi:MAG: hypothetical protein SGJ07_00240 [Rhodospirillaceae bacterium]|nr:hypothetical protein [Rhodospirillaceae bacterium]